VYDDPVGLVSSQFDSLLGSSGIAKPAGIRVVSCEHHRIERNEFAGTVTNSTIMISI